MGQSEGLLPVSPEINLGADRPYQCQGWSNRAESRRIARQCLAIRDSVNERVGDRRFRYSVIPRIRGQAQCWNYALQATQVTHLHYPKQTS